MSGKRPGKKSKSSPKKKPVDPAAAAAKKERRAKAAALREEQRRKARRTAMLKQVGLVTVAGAAVLGLVLWLVFGRTPDEVDPPKGFDDAGAITVGNADAPVTVTLVEDFSCPHCAQAEADNAELLAGYAAGDEVKVEYKPIAFLDSHSSDDYASRALNASVCVVEEDPENWTAIHQALMANQPPQGEGLSDDRLTELATAAGADESTVSQCIDDRLHDDWIEWTTHRAQSADDFSGTPMILVNGDKVGSPTPDAIDAAVQEALAE